VGDAGSTIVPHRRKELMTVADILRIKGASVTTVSSSASAVVVAQRLQRERIGAMIVTNDGSSIEGIISERDLAYGLATHVGNLPHVAVSELMTKAVITCSPRDSVSEIAKVMTQRRIRHLPVKDGHQLVGIITIGDVLKHRLDEVQLEANVLRDYAIARG
jgi:CBS domain-containing protein